MSKFTHNCVLCKCVHFNNNIVQGGANSLLLFTEDIKKVLVCHGYISYLWIKNAWLNHETVYIQKKKDNFRCSCNKQLHKHYSLFERKFKHIAIFTIDFSSTICLFLWKWYRIKKEFFSLCIDQLTGRRTNFWPSTL